MEILIKALQLILSLSILVVLHELGHFLPAKFFKTKVEKFYLFFDPWFSLVKKKIGDTEYGIGWLPLRNSSLTLKLDHILFCLLIHFITILFVRKTHRLHLHS